MTTIAELRRTRIIVLALAIAPLWLASNIIHFELAATPINGAAAVWSVISREWWVFSRPLVASRESSVDEWREKAV